MLEAIEVELTDGSMHTVKDKNGTEYKVPYYCLNDPINAEIANEQHANVEEPDSEETFELSFKMGAKIFKVKATNKTEIMDLKKKVLKKSKAKGKKEDVRLIYMGKELSDELSLYNYDINPKNMLLATVRK